MTNNIDYRQIVATMEGITAPTTIKPMLACNYFDEAPKHYLISEKYDGIRCLWDGHQLISRNGKVFNAPNWFIQSLPQDIALDGELWSGYNTLEKTVGIVRSKHADWSGVKFMIFDTINKRTASKRYQLLSAWASASGFDSHIQIVKQRTCPTKTQLNTFECEVIKRGGEGLVLKDADSEYEMGERSPYLLKLKRFKQDEANIISIKHNATTGLMNTIECRYKGKTFKIGSGFSDKLRRTPPKVGTSVSFNFSGTTRLGTPRCASFVSVRNYE